MAEFAFQLSKKNNTGDMLNIRADTYAEFEAAVNAAFGDGATQRELASYLVPTASSGVPGPAASTPQPAYDLGQCPVSGHPLTKKTRKDGTGTFVACSGFPKCSYIVKG